MKFGLKALLMCVTVMCFILGAHRTGYNSGRSVGRKEGYDYANAKYHYFLNAYAEIKWGNGYYWDLIGEWFREGDVNLIREFNETEYEWNIGRSKGLDAYGVPMRNGISDDGHLESFPKIQSHPEY